MSLACLFFFTHHLKDPKLESLLLSALTGMNEQLEKERRVRRAVRTLIMHSFVSLRESRNAEKESKTTE